MNIVVCGNYGATNLGDEAIMDGIISIIRNTGGDHKITVLSSNPSETSKSHHCDSLFMFPAGVRSLFVNFFNGEFFRTLRAVRKCDLFIFGGGGLFTDEKLKAVIIWWIQAKWAYLLRKPVFCLGQSVGPLHTFLGRFLTKSVFKRANKITVRDLASKKLLDNFGVHNSIILADPAFLLTINEDQTAKREEYIVFSVRPWHKVVNSAERERLYKICAHFLDWVFDEFELKSVLLPFQGIQDDDFKALNNVFIHTNNRKTVMLHRPCLNYREAIDLIINSTAVVGMRLHSLIFSTICHKPFIALSYSQKVRQLCTDLEMDDYIIDWEKLDLAELKSRFARLMNNYENVKSHLSGMDIVMRHKGHQHEGLIKKLMSEIDRQSA